MPFLDETVEGAIVRGIGLDPVRSNASDDDGKAVPGEIANRPSLLGAAFRQENLIGSLLADESRMFTGFIEEGFNPIEGIRGTEYEQYADRFADVNNSFELEALKRDIDQEARDRRRLEASPIGGLRPESP